MAAHRRGNRDDSRGPMRMRRARRKVCSFCVDKVTEIDYKDIAKLRKYVSERGRYYQEGYPQLCKASTPNDKCGQKGKAYCITSLYI